MLDLVWFMVSLLLLVISILIIGKIRELSQLLVRQIAYDAVAYSVDKTYESYAKTGLALTATEMNDEAIAYFKKFYPFVKKENAQKYCQSLAAKVGGAGYSKDFRV